MTTKAITLEQQVENPSNDGTSGYSSLPQGKMPTTTDRSLEFQSPKYQVMRLAHKQALMVWVKMAEKMGVTQEMLAGWLKDSGVVLGNKNTVCPYCATVNYEYCYDVTMERLKTDDPDTREVVGNAYSCKCGGWFVLDIEP